MSTNLPFPDRLRCKLAGEARGTITDSDVFNNTVIFGNYPVDPFNALATSSLSGYDVLATLYGKYRVLGSRIKVRASLSSSASLVSGGIELCVFPASQSTSATTMNDARGQNRAKYDVKAGNYQVATVNNSATTEQVTGREKASILGDPGFAGSTGAAPANTTFWVICTQFETSSTNLNLTIDIQLEYDIEFFERLRANDAVSMILRLNDMLLVYEKIRLAKSEKKEAKVTKEAREAKNAMAEKERAASLERMRQRLLLASLDAVEESYLTVTPPVSSRKKIP